MLANVGCDALYVCGYRAALATCQECDNPALAWRNLCKLYRELLAGNSRRSRSNLSGSRQADQGVEI